MNYLYLILDLGSLSVPFLFSFHPKLKFYAKWRFLFPAMLTTMVIYIPWDVVFTAEGFWGFNDTYLMGIPFMKLPLEEWLFFICIPYACVFTHESLLYYFPNMKLPKKATVAVCNFLIVVSLLIALFNYDKWYTLINFLYAAVLILIVIRTNPELMRRYLLTFLIMLIPFFYSKWHTHRKFY